MISCYNSEGHTKLHSVTCNECERFKVEYVCAKEDDACEVASNPSLIKVERIKYFENSNSLASLDTQENKIKQHATLDEIENCFPHQVNAGMKTRTNLSRLGQEVKITSRGECFSKS